MTSDVSASAPTPTPLPPWNALAVVAFVLAFVVPPGAIACGHIARGQIRRTGEQGAGLALAGLILGYVFTALIALFVVIWVVTIVASLLGFVALFGQLPHDAISTG